MKDPHLADAYAKCRKPCKPKKYTEKYIQYMLLTGWKVRTGKIFAQALRNCLREQISFRMERPKTVNNLFIILLYEVKDFKVRSRDTTKITELWNGPNVSTPPPFVIEFSNIFESLNIKLVAVVVGKSIFVSYVMKLV